MVLEDESTEFRPAREDLLLFKKMAFPFMGLTVTRDTSRSRSSSASVSDHCHFCCIHLRPRPKDIMQLSARMNSSQSRSQSHPVPRLSLSNFSLISNNALKEYEGCTRKGFLCTVPPVFDLTHIFHILSSPQGITIEPIPKHPQ